MLKQLRLKSQLDIFQRIPEFNFIQWTKFAAIFINVEKSSIDFALSVKVKDLSENDVKVDVLSQFSNQNSSGTVVIIKEWAIPQSTVHLLKNEKWYFILNHFNSHVYKFLAFAFKNEFVNVFESSLLLRGREGGRTPLN